LEDLRLQNPIDMKLDKHNDKFRVYSEAINLNINLERVHFSGFSAKIEDNKEY